jgi:hypothetical protein
MSPATQAPPKVRWGKWAIALFALFMGRTLFQMFGPHPKIMVSAETTVITSPLRENGLPDYKSYWRDLGREGVTPENNGAALFWKAMWPGYLEPRDRHLLCDTLEMPEPTSDSGIPKFYQGAWDLEIGLWLVRQHEPDFTPEDSGLTTNELSRMYYRAGADRVIWNARDCPWTGKRCPPLAALLKKHQGQFELLIEASKRPRFWSPSPSVLNELDENIGYVQVPEIYTLRDAGRALSIRAMWHLGEGRTEAAWEDLAACYRLAKLLNRGCCVYEEQQAQIMHAFASRSTIVMLHHDNPNSELARHVFAELELLALSNNLAPALDYGSRILYADSATGLATGRDKLLDICRQQIGYPLEPAEYLRFDWNYVLREGSRLHKRLGDAVARKTRKDRLEALEPVNEELALLEEPIHNPRQLIGGIVSRSARNNLAVSHLCWAVVPVMEEFCNDLDLAQATFDKARAAAALAVYRAENGEYPDKLEQLVPAAIPQVPTDLYSGKPFVYERKSDGGYLLYSVYENGTDDGGNDDRVEIVDGEWVAERSEDFDFEKTDLVVRVPVPEFDATPETVDMKEVTKGY